MTCEIPTPRQSGLAPEGKKKPLVIAHRGSSGNVPENTLAAFKQAVADGADVIELDVRLSKDKQVVVCHDPSVDRTTNGTGNICNLTLSQIKALDAGHHFTIDAGYHFPFRGQRLTIPTLQEVLEALPSTPLHVEIKVNDKELVDRVLELVDKHSRFGDVTFIILVKTKRNALARYIRKRAPGANIGHSASEVARLYALSKMRAPRWFKPRGKTMQIPVRKNGLLIASSKFIRDAHGLGLQVQIWTVDDEDEMKLLLSLGADALYTGYPAELRKIVDSGKWLEKPVPR